MLTPCLLGLGVAPRIPWVSLALLAIVLGACEASKKKKAETEREPPTPTAKQQQRQPITAASKVGDRILAELRVLKPKIRFESVGCPPNIKPTGGAKMTCVVVHEGNADRQIEVMFTDASGGFMWGRKYLGSSFDRRLKGVLGARWPVPIDAVSCPQNVVAYPKGFDECKVTLKGGQVAPVLVSWQNSLGKFTANRLSDVAALQKSILDQLVRRGDKVKSVSCPRRILLSKSVFKCRVERTDGTSMTLPVTSENGNATIAVAVRPETSVPKKPVKTGK